MTCTEDLFYFDPPEHFLEAVKLFSRPAIMSFKMCVKYLFKSYPLGKDYDETAFYGLLEAGLDMTNAGVSVFRNPEMVNDMTDYVDKRMKPRIAERLSQIYFSKEAIAGCRDSVSIVPRHVLGLDPGCSEIFWVL